MKDKTMQALVDGQKSCRRCGTVKPLEAFHRNPRSGDGRHTRCKACILFYMKHERIRTPGRRPGRPYLTSAQMAIQTCSRCGISGPAVEFPPVLSTRRGCNTYCRSCVRAIHRAEMQRRWRDPVAGYKHRMRVFTGRAIKMGVLVPRPCDVCGLTDVHAHHHDYSKPLEVRWLCRQHHMALHRKGEAI